MDHRSDIYSLAGVLYFLLTGRRPVPDGPLVDMLMHVVADMPMSSRKLNTAISLKLEGAILHALDKNVDDRFNSASAFSDALKAAVPQLSIWSQVRTSAFISQYKQDLQRDIERWQTIARTASDVEVSQDLHNDDSTNSLKLGDATRSEFRPMTPTPLRAYSSIRPNTPFPTARSPSQLSRSKTIRDLLLLSIGISAGTALSAGITFFLVNDRGVETSAPPPVATIPSVKSPPSSPQIVPLEVPTKAPVRKTSKRRARSSTSKKLHSPSPRKAPILSEEPKAPPPPASPKERLRRIIGKATRLLERPESNSQKDALSMLLANANRTHQSKRIDPQQVDALEKQLRDIQSKVP